MIMVNNMIMKQTREYRGKTQNNNWFLKQIMGYSNVISLISLIILYIIPSSFQISSHHQTNSILSTFQYPSLERCVNGAPLQWRPHLDAASKAHLAPIVALATLRHINLTPVQLQSSHHYSNRNQAHHHQSLVYHLQNLNNVGVTIEATFTISNVLKGSTPGQSPKAKQDIRLFYHVTASLTTTGALITLANSGNNTSNGENQARGSASISQGNNHMRSQLMHTSKLTRLNGADSIIAPCALELSEQELVKKVNKLFKMNRNYIIYLEQLQLQQQQQAQYQHSSVFNLAEARMRAPPNVIPFRGQQMANTQQVSRSYQSDSFLASGSPGYQFNILYPFASHELLTNQTSRSVSKILCKNCAQAPQIHLVNATLISTVAPPSQLQEASSGGRLIRLDCRVTGYPTPWIEWYKNGKLLRNRTSKSGQTMVNIRTTKWKRRHNVRISRLEFELQSSRNDTGLYECRAMNVAAREPSVGTYTLLVQPNQIALVPLQIPQPEAGSASSNNENSLSGSGQQSSTTERPPTTSEPAGQTPTPSEQTKYSTGSGNTTTASSSRTNETSISTSTTKSISVEADVSSSSAMPSFISRESSTTTQAPTSVWLDVSSNRNDKHKYNPQQHSNQQQQQLHQHQQQTNNNQPNRDDPSKQNNNIHHQGGPQNPVVGQPCPRDAHDNFCLNKGTCVLIEHIEEYLCNCAEGYHGHRCEYKSLGHQKGSH